MRRFLQSIITLLLVCACMLVRAQAPQTVNSGQQTQVVTFPGPGCVYNWTNDKPGIGLPASGTGNIPAFTAINNGTTPIVATIKATPVLATFAYIANTGNNTVSVIDGASHSVTATFNVGTTPWGVAASPDGKRVYTANNVTNDVSVINTTNNSVTSIPVGGNPFAIAVSPDSKWVYVSNEGDGNISVIDAQSNSVLTTIDNVGPITAICISPDGKWIYAASEASPLSVYVIDASNNTIASSIPISASQNVGMVITPDGKTLYVSNNQDNTANPNGTVTVINLVTKSTSTITVGSQPNLSFKSGPYGIAMNSTGTRVYVVCSYQNEVDVINTATNTVIKTIPIATGEPFTVSVSNDDKELYVSNRNSNTVEVFNTSDYSKITTIADANFNMPFSSGNFISKGPGCGGSPISFTITVKAVTPQLTATAVTGTISACIGSPSASPNIQQFKVSGSNLSANIIATAPTGFEVSLAAGGGYGSNVTLNQVGGVVSNKVIYVRSAASATGSISGNVVLQSTGAADKNIFVQGVINAVPTVNTIPDQGVSNGAPTTAVNFTGTGNTFTWTNDQPSIGLAATGVGDIASFTAINTGSSPVVATITATPLVSGFAYIANSGAGTVSVINTGTNLVVTTIPVGTSPLGVTKGRDGSRVYVANGSSNNVSVINSIDNTMVTTVAVGTAPQCLVVSADGNYVYVTNNISNTVSVISTSSNTVSGTINVGINPASLCISPDGLHIYVVNNGDNTISVINTSLNSVETTINPGTVPMGIAISPDGGKLYITNYTQNTVSVISTATNNVISTINVGSNPWGISVSPDGNTVYVANTIDGTLSVIDASNNTAITAVNAGFYPWGVSVSPDGREVYVTNQFSNNVSVINTADNTLKTTVAVGTAPASIGDFITSGTVCSGLPTTFTITVYPSNTPTITAVNTPSAVNTTYGTASPSATFNVSGTNMEAGILVTPPPGFEVSADNVTFSAATTVGGIGTITSIPVYIRLKSTSPVGDYSGNILLTSKNAADVNVIMAPSRVNPATLTITANNAAKTYGAVLTGSTGSTAFTTTGLQNGEKVGSVTIAYGAGAAANAAAGIYTGSVTATAPTGGTFSAVNYTINFVKGDIIVSLATLTITANNAPKTYGTVLTGSAGSTAFTATGLQNGEKVGSVTIAYGTGAAATDPANTYTGSVIASAAIGGTFIAGNYIVVYKNGNIIVNPAAALPVVTAGTVTGAITACAGSPSASPNIQQFTVSGSGLSGNITATAPAGFEVSLSPNSGFGNSVTLNQSGGKVTDVLVYVRAKASAITGDISGKVVLASAGAAGQKVAVEGVVNSLPTVNAVSDQTKTAGDVTEAISFTGTGNIFTWTNDNPSIGLPAVGDGDIPSFTTTNNTTGTIKAKITVTPASKGFAYIANGNDGTVSVINTANNKIVSTIDVGQNPTFVSVSPDGKRVYVVNSSSNSVSVISTSNNKVVGSIPVGFLNQAVVSRDGNLLYVANSVANTIEAYNTSTYNRVWSLSVGDGASGIALNGDGSRMYVSNANSNDVYVINLSNNNIVAKIGVGSRPDLLAITPDDSKVYVANFFSNSVSVINTANNTVTATITTGVNPDGVAISPDGNFAYISNYNANSVSVISIATNTVVTTIPVNKNPLGIAVSPDGYTLYVINQGSGNVSLINTATNQVTSTVTVGSFPGSPGNFITAGTGCTGVPTTFTITVNAVEPTITTGPVTGAITACAGSPSASPNIQQFKVSGSGLSGDITATAPTAFDVSLSAKTGFAKSVTLTPVNGSVTDVVVYVRSAVSASVGPLSDKITLGSAGVANVTVGVSGVVNALPTVNQVSDQTKKDGEATDPVNFTGTGNKFRWTNDKPEIGLPATGLGDIASFKAINAGGGEITATITVTPLRLGYAYIPDLQSNVVSVINLASNLVETTLPVGNNPIGVAINAANNLVYITNTGGSTVSVIDPATNTGKGTIIVGNSPYGIKPNTDGSLLFVANLNGGTVSVINTSTNTVVHTIDGFTGPIDVAVSADGGSLYVSNNRSTIVSVISTADYTIQKTITVGDAPYGLCFSPDGSRLYVANQASRDISVINTATNTVSNTIKGNFGPLYLGISPDGNWLYVPNVSSTTVSVVNTTTNATVATIEGFGQPTGISFSPDGKYIYITNQSSNKLSVIDAATNTVVDNIPVAGDPVALGNFLLPGPGCEGNPVTFTIKVKGLAPVLTHGAVTGNIIACAGSPSASPNIQQFAVSGSNLPGDITATAPVGFEVSLSANSGFGKSVTITRTGGSVTNIIVYARSADYAIGSVSGDVGLSCPGLSTQTVAVRAFVNAVTTVNTVPNQTKESGEATDAVTFSGTGSQYRWTNDKPEIGLPASGTGDIASFIAVNNGSLPVKANITVTPISIGYAYIPNAQSNNVSIINLANNAVISTPEVGEDPYGVAVNKSNSSAYITNSGGNTVSVINTVTNTVSGIITVGTSPYGIKLNADGSLLYVANFGSNEISIISTATNGVLKTIGGFTAPADVAISPDGSMIYVSNTNANTVSVVRTSDYSIIKTIPVGSAPYMMGISPDGSKVYVANDGSKDISVVSTATNTVLAVIDGNFSSYGVGLSPDGNFLYVPNLSSDNISIINTATNAIIAVIGGFSGPTGISFSSDGRYYYVTNQHSNQLSIVDAQTNTVLNNITVGNDPIAMGNFLLQGSACDGKPTTFTITVNQALPAIISTYGQLSPVNTIYGTPSPSSNFSVSGASMREGIKVTPPTGIEISTDNINFSNTLTVGAAGTIATATIYVRLAKTTPVGSYGGFITLESSGVSAISFILPACVVSKAPLTVTANNKNKDYGTLLTGSSGSTDFTITGLQNSETAETVTVAYGNGAAADAPAGSYPGSVTPSALAGGTFDPKNYTPGYATGDITINKVPLTITADNKSKSYKDPNPMLTITYQGFVNNEGFAQLTIPPVISTTADVTSLPGKYPILVSAATSPNYTIAFVNGVLTISGINLPLKIPNTFTPNGDGINDTWAIVNIDEYPGCTVNIFNRWGQNVFSSVGYGKLWDGSYKGALLPVSTYYYIIDLKNESKVYSGSITIIR